MTGHIISLFLFIFFYFLFNTSFQNMSKVSVFSHFIFSTRVAAPFILTKADNIVLFVLHILFCLHKILQFQKLNDYLNQLRPSFNEIVGMCPTGWEFTGTPSGKALDGITSEHPFPDVYKYGEASGKTISLY